MSRHCSRNNHVKDVIPIPHLIRPRKKLNKFYVFNNSSMVGPGWRFGYQRRLQGIAFYAFDIWNGVPNSVITFCEVSMLIPSITSTQPTKELSMGILLIKIPTVYPQWHWGAGWALAKKRPSESSVGALIPTFVSRFLTLLEGNPNHRGLQATPLIKRLAVEIYNGFKFKGLWHWNGLPYASPFALA